MDPIIIILCVAALGLLVWLLHEMDERRRAECALEAIWWSLTDKQKEIADRALKTALDDDQWPLGPY